MLIHSVPNGGKRHAAVAAKMRLEGLVPGMPDLHVPEWGLWIEMKRTRGGRLSPVQREIIARLEAIGDTVIVGRGWIDALEQVEAFHRRYAARTSARND